MTLTLINSISPNTASPNTHSDSLQSYSTNFMSATNVNSVDCAYDSIESFNDHLMCAVMQSGSVFAAMSLIKEINDLNGYEVVTGWQVAKVKEHFRQNSNPSKDETRKRKSTSYGVMHYEPIAGVVTESNKRSVSTEDRVTVSALENTVNHIAGVKTEKVLMSKDKREGAQKAYTQLQKGYMQLLSYRI